MERLKNWIKNESAKQAFTQQYFKVIGMNLNRQYDRIGKDYIRESKAFFKKHKDYSREFIKQNTKSLKGKIALDIGCGSGEDIGLLEKNGAKTVFGIDSSKTMVSEAKKTVKHPERVFCESIERTHFPNAFFDIAVARFSLHYLKKLDKAYNEIARILKPKGDLVMVVGHPLRDFFLNKKSSKKGFVTVKLYNKKVSVTYPSHSLDDYLSSAFTENFILEFFEEIEEKELDLGKKRAIPGSIGIKAVKK